MQLKCFSALWALCHGNNEHIEVVAKNGEFFQQWSNTIDACIGNDGDPLLASVCLGVGATVYVNTLEHKNKLVAEKIPNKVGSLLKKYPQSVHIVIQSLALLGDLVQGVSDLDESQPTLHAMEIALNNWKESHMKNVDASCIILEKLSCVVEQFAFLFTKWNIPELVSESLAKHPGHSAIQTYGTDLLHREGDAVEGGYPGRTACFKGHVVRVYASQGTCDVLFTHNSHSWLQHGLPAASLTNEAKQKGPLLTPPKNALKRIKDRDGYEKDSLLKVCVHFLS